MLWPEFRVMLLGLLSSPTTRLARHFAPAPKTEPSGGDPDGG